MNLFLNVKRRGVDNEVAPILFILSAPDELRVKVTIAPLISDAHGVLLLALQDRLELRRGDILPLGFIVLKGLNGLGFLAIYYFSEASWLATDWIIL